MTQNAGFLHGHVVGPLVKVVSGTTHATANTTNPTAHGLTDVNGDAITPANYSVLAIALNNAEGVVYTGATAIDADNIDVLSAGTAVPYKAFIFYTGDID